MFNSFKTKRITRKGLIFQVPESPLCSFRYLVHSTGTGEGWNEGLDVDQISGLDYREFCDLRIGIRKRLSQQHTTFADVTVGGMHKRGGCSVLDFVDASTDISADDGTYCGGGIVFCKGTDSLWCWSILTEYTTISNPRELKWSPRSICKGADFTWTGGHEFDASVDFSQSVNFDCTVDFKKTTDISILNVSGMLTCLSSGYFTNDVSCKADLVVDGTAVFTTEVDISGNCDISGNLYVSGTSTSIAPLYAGGESITFPNGMIMKMGYIADPGVNYDVSFGTAFPTAIISIGVTPVHATNTWASVVTSGRGVGGFTISDAGAITGCYWMAIGR